MANCPEKISYFFQPAPLVIAYNGNSLRYTKEDQSKSNHGEQTGGSPSEQQPKTQDQDANRNESVEGSTGR